MVLAVPHISSSRPRRTTYRNVLRALNAKLVNDGIPRTVILDVATHDRDDAAGSGLAFELRDDVGRKSAFVVGCYS
jgi:hypothetical protein